MMILQRAPSIFLSNRRASNDMPECIVAATTISTQPKERGASFEDIDWKITVTIPPMPADTTFAQLEQRARQSLVENLRSVADAIEAEQYAQPEDTD
jgi:hypothetical protein